MKNKGSHFRKPVPISRLTWLRKKRIFESKKTAIVSSSSWMFECAKNSSLLKDSRIELIHNGLDTDKYKPLDKVFSRDILGLPKEGKIVLFGAVNSSSDSRKGYKYLLKALKEVVRMRKFEDLYLVVFGASSSEKIFDLPINLISLAR